ncbi:unknown [Bifidobacterium pseudocatenulatum CAG:263]|nr:unknown [Bifidobacterium pseudocatenulatum CAG:263]
MAVTASLQSLSAARSRICCDARTPVNPKTAPRTTTTTTTAMMIWR